MKKIYMCVYKVVEVNSTGSLIVYFTSEYIKEAIYYFDLVVKSHNRDNFFIMKESREIIKC